MGHLNIGPVYRVGQVEIERSSKTSLFQETEGENVLREWDFRPHVVLCFQSFQGPHPWTPPGLSPIPTGGSQCPETPTELSNRDLAQMRIGGQRTAFEIHQSTKCKDLWLLLILFGVNLSLTSVSFVSDS